MLDIDEAIDQLEDELGSNQLDSAHLDTINSLAKQIPAHELTRIVSNRPIVQSAVLFRVLKKDEALNVFENLPPSYQADLIQALRGSEVAEIIEGLDPDDRAELFGELPATVVKSMMKGLSPAERAMTSAVLGYPREAIGRYMSPEVLSLHSGWDARRALDTVRSRIDEPETVYLLPVLGSGRELVGVVSLRTLVGADPATPVTELMREPSSVEAMTNREDASRSFLDQRLIAMPVVDAENRLLGILTMDDVLDIIDEEDAEDAARGSGAEPLNRSYMSSSIVHIVKSRIVWLMVLAVSAVLTVKVLDLYESRLAQVVALALFIPLLTGTGGNAGNQAATTVTRALAVGEVRVRDLLLVLWREIRVGASLGMVLGSLGFLIAGLVYGWALGSVIGLTLLCICTMAAAAGGFMPILAKKIGADPAVFSNPFISTFCDATGLIIYFTIATVILRLH